MSSLSDGNRRRSLEGKIERCQNLSSSTLQVPQVQPYYLDLPRNHLSDSELCRNYLSNHDDVGSSSDYEFHHSNNDLENALQINMKFVDVHSSSSELANIQDLDTQSETSTTSGNNIVPDSILPGINKVPDSFQLENTRNFYIESSKDSIYCGGRDSPDKFEKYPHRTDVIRWLPLKRRIIWLRNNIQSFGFTAFFIVINATLFISRAYQYKHTNFLHIGARACGKISDMQFFGILGRARVIPAKL